MIGNDDVKVGRCCCCRTPLLCVTAYILSTHYCIAHPPSLTLFLLFYSLNIVFLVLGRGGRFVQLEDTIKGFQEILSGKLDSLPEGSSYHHYVTTECFFLHSLP